MTENAKRLNLFIWILITGTFTGTVDILFAFIMNYHVPAATILKFIASGLFGSTAFAPGTEMIYCGLFLHFFFAFFWTIIFFLFHTKLLNILKFKFILILITGMVIWAVMNLIVIPLSKIPPQQFHFINIIEDIAVLILAYGLPITLITNKFYTSTSAN
jgi:hypothetical protein